MYKILNVIVKRLKFWMCTKNFVRLATLNFARNQEDWRIVLMEKYFWKLDRKRRWHLRDDQLKRNSIWKIFEDWSKSQKMAEAFQDWISEWDLLIRFSANLWIFNLMPYVKIWKTIENKNLSTTRLIKIYIGEVMDWLMNQNIDQKSCFLTIRFLEAW